jgi:hypothetical protein
MQNALTIITPINKAEIHTLNAYLLAIGNDIRGNPYIDFKKALSTHFCRWVIIDETADQPQLLFNANFDGPVDAYLYGLIDWLGAALDDIWGRCTGYPAGRATDPRRFREKFYDYLVNHAYPIPILFRAYYGRTVQEVRAAMALRDSLDALLTRPEAEALAQQLVALPIVPEPEKTNLVRAALMPVVGAIGAVFGGVQAAISGGSRIQFDPNDPGPTLNVPLSVTERPAIVQNELTIIAPIEPKRVGWVQFVLSAFGKVVRPPFITDGKLSDMTTIHFARWAIIDGRDGVGKRLHFESNYDGSWEKYIDDFIDHAWAGLDMTFGSCIGYPVGGSRNSQYFKQAIIDHQWRAQVFYSAYPQRSVRNIINDLAIYDQVRVLLGQKAITDWLGRL